MSELVTEKPLNYVYECLGRCLVVLNTTEMHMRRKSVRNSEIADTYSAELNNGSSKWLVV